MKLPPELAFLAPHIATSSEPFRTAIWLRSDFEATVWTVNFASKRSYDLDWRVKLDDDSLLTEAKNSDLLYGFKYLLILSTRNNSNKIYETNDIKGQQMTSIIRACHIVDILLLNAKRFQLSTFGLAGLTSGNLKEILETIACSSFASESIYNWTQCLHDYCLEIVAHFKKEDLLEIIQARPELSNITESQKRHTLGIELTLIPLVRAALYKKGYYRMQRTHGAKPNSVRLSAQIYPNTILGKLRKKPLFGILCISDPAAVFRREYLAAPVTTGRAIKHNPRSYRVYRSLIYRLRILHQIGIPAPPVPDLVAIENFQPSLESLGRFRTIPTSLVFDALRDAIEFHLAHGRMLVEAYCSVMVECKRRTIAPTELSVEQFEALISEEALSFGIKRVGLSARQTENQLWHQKIKVGKSEHYENLRQNHGLIEMVAIYVGCVQIVVGTLMAKRASELIELPADGCLDETEQWLLTHNRKSSRGVFGLRRKIARPIAPIAVSMIKNIVQMQHTLLRAGCIGKMQRLFSTPHLSGHFDLVDASHTSYNKNFDLFCDYFETPFNKTQERYYIRQHQLRRFFAMVFFNSASFGQLDTLRWMLGHEEAIYVWNYITETLDGATLRSAAAQYATEQLHSYREHSFDNLAQLLKSHYGTDDFALIDSEELEMHILDLMNDGLVSIEPVFLTDEGGERIRVIAKITNLNPGLSP